MLQIINQLVFLPKKLQKTASLTVTDEPKFLHDEKVDIKLNVRYVIVPECKSVKRLANPKIITGGERESS